MNSRVIFEAFKSKIMKSIFTLLTILIAFSVNAQPNITVNNLPQWGDTTIISICSDTVNPGSPGAMITWDMSHLTEDQQQYFLFYDPAMAPVHDSFPGADLAGESWEFSYSFYNTSATSLSVRGYTFPSSTDTIIEIYDDLQDIARFPLTYNSIFTDTFSGTSYIPMVGPIAFDGTLDFEADGYGTLILPNGTYNNVVRYHFIAQRTNYIGGFPSGTQTKEQWGWISEDHRFWLLLMEINTVSGFSNSLVWYDKDPYNNLSIGIESANSKDIGVYPNPLRSGEKLKIKWQGNEWAVVQIFDASGRIVRSEERMMNVGLNTVDTGTNVAGVYFLRISSEAEVFTNRISIIE